MVGSYSIVSVTGAANTMPSGPKANAVPVIGTGCAGKPVAGSAVMTTSSLTAPAGNTRFTASSAREMPPPVGRAACWTMTDAVPVAEPEVAVMVAGPSATAATTPVGETLATVDAEDAQATEAPLIVAPF